MGVLCGLAGSPAPALAADPPEAAALLAALETQIVQTVERVEPTVVSIARDRAQLFGRDRGHNFDGIHIQDRHGIEEPDYIPREFGTGVLISPNGLILTNYHVVQGGPIDGKETPESDVLYVRLTDRRGFYARIVAADPRSDLAVIRIDADRLPAIELGPVGEDSQVRKGQFAIILGNPYAIARNGSPSCTFGIVSNVARSADMEHDIPELSPRPLQRTQRRESLHRYGTLLQIDARLNVGASGGPVVNLRGRMIGLATSLAALQGFDGSHGFAIPVDGQFLRIVDSLKQGYEVEYGFIGIDFGRDGPTSLRGAALQEVRLRGYSGGIQIHRVVTHGPAYDAGIQNEDIIVSVDGKPVLSSGDLMREVGLMGPGHKARFTICRLREAGEKYMEVTLAKFPMSEDRPIIATRRRREPWRGLVVDYPMARAAWRQSEDPYFLTRSVVVLDVLEGSPAAAHKELRPGVFITHVDGKPVTTPDEFMAVAEKLAGNVALSIFTTRQNPSVTITVEPKPPGVAPRKGP
jgi:serine protease Do